MNYPVAYAVIPEEEKTYIVRSGEVKYENSAEQSAVTPIANWFKNVDDMGVIAHLGYFYGFWHIWRDVKGYLG